MKLNPAEKHLYTILAERAEMTLDEWIQSLPRQQLTQLEAEDPEDYQSLMMDFAQHMLAGGADSSNASAKKADNWHTCPACGEKKYASAYPGESTICRMCTRKQAEEKQEEVIEEPEPEPAPEDGRYKTCGQCGEKRYKSVFAPGQTVCKHCQKEEPEAHAQADPDIIETPEGEGVDEKYRSCERCGKKKGNRQFVPGADLCKDCKQEIDNQTNRRISRRKCMMCDELRPVKAFRHALSRMCNDCMEKAEARSGVEVERSK